MSGWGADALVVVGVAASDGLDVRVNQVASATGDDAGVAGLLGRGDGNEGGENGGVLHLDGVEYVGDNIRRLKEYQRITSRC